MQEGAEEEVKKTKECALDRDQRAWHVCFHSAFASPVPRRGPWAVGVGVGVGVVLALALSLLRCRAPAVCAAGGAAVPRAGCAPYSLPNSAAPYSLLGAVWALGAGRLLWVALTEV